MNDIKCENVEGNAKKLSGRMVKDTIVLENRALSDSRVAKKHRFGGDDKYDIVVCMKNVFSY